MLEILKNSKSRRYFIVITILLMAVTLFAYHALETDLTGWNSWKGLLKNIMVEVFASTLAAGFFLWLFSFLAPNEKPLQDIESLDSVITKQRHKYSLSDTSHWLHDGQIGRWVRVAAIPYLAKRGLTNSRKIRIEMILFNPKNEKLIEKYVEYRQSLEFEDNLDLSTKSIKCEILATIVLSQYYNKSKHPMDISIYLSDDFLGYRIDINSICGFLTHINHKDVPTLSFNKGDSKDKRTNYNLFSLQFDYKKSLLMQINSNNPNRLLSLHDINNKDRIGDVKEYLRDIDLLLYEDDDTIENIIKRATATDKEYV